MGEQIRKGSRKLIYEYGKKSNCIYNQYNDYFILLCITKFRDLTIGNSDGIVQGLIDSAVFFANLVVLALIIILTPVSIPIMVLLNKRSILKDYPDIDYKNLKD